MATQMDDSRKRFAGIVLCGGRSRRMGRAKADLVFGLETMLQRVVRLLSGIVDRIVVVAATEQVVPYLDETVTIVRDRLQYAGPLAGISIGLDRLSVYEGIEAAYVTSCDVPFLKPAFVRELFLRLENHDVVVPFDEQHYHPLAAVYRRELAAKVAELVGQEVRRPRDLFNQVRTRKLEIDVLKRVDPELRTLINLNTPEDYRIALQSEGLPIPSWLDT